jgi:hypothetical protein
MEIIGFWQKWVKTVKNGCFSLKPDCRSASGNCKSPLDNCKSAPGNQQSLPDNCKSAPGSCRSASDNCESAPGSWRSPSDNQPPASGNCPSSPDNQPAPAVNCYLAIYLAYRRPDPQGAAFAHSELSFTIRKQGDDAALRRPERVLRRSRRVL